MTSLVRFRWMLLAGCLLAAATACPNKSETREAADRAAKAVIDKVEASHEFEYRKRVRIETLRAVHAVAASQAMLIGALAPSLPLVEKDRSKVNEKLVIFQMRLDETGNAIQSLELVEATGWEPHDDAVSKSLERVEAARDDAWKALKEADQISDRTSMR